MFGAVIFSLCGTTDGFLLSCQVILTPDNPWKKPAKFLLSARQISPHPKMALLVLDF
jgi:hypothetical protein